MRRRATDTLTWIPREATDDGENLPRLPANSLRKASPVVTKMIWAIYHSYLLDLIGHGPPNFGAFCLADVGDITSEDKYMERKEILSLMNRHMVSYLIHARMTAYCSESTGFLGGLRRALRYRKVYQSILKNGIKWDPKDAYSVPWLFASQEGVVRIDGHHRAAIARFLGHPRIHVLLFTPTDLLKIPQLTRELRDLLLDMHDPNLISPQSQATGAST